MTNVEYAVNITIIIIFLALSIMAFQLIFNIAANNAKCKACKQNPNVNGGLAYTQTNSRTQLPQILIPSSASSPSITGGNAGRTAATKSVSLTGNIF